jgi:peptidylprolyl isomerase
VHHRTTARTATVAKLASPDVSVFNPPGTPAVTGSVQSAYTLHYVDTRVGTGELAAPGKLYSVHYIGWLLDGTKFDSSYDRGKPYEFTQGERRVIAGWDTGFEGMRVGGKRRLYIPYQLAYGEIGTGPIPAKAALVFDVELVAQSDPKVPPATASVSSPERGQ